MEILSRLNEYVCTHFLQFISLAYPSSSCKRIRSVEKGGIGYSCHRSIVVFMSFLPENCQIYIFLPVDSKTL